MSNTQSGLERLLALCLLAFLAVPLAIAALLIVVIDRQRPFYTPQRVGMGSRSFRQVKLRTMRRTRERSGEVTVRGDPRVTRLGRLLRRSKFDEVPQLLNIVRGEMGFLGPRPESPDNLRFYSPASARVFWLRPGLVSPASLLFAQEEHLIRPDRWEADYCSIVERKSRLDLDYFGSSSWFDHVRFAGRVLAALVRGWPTAV